MERSKEIGGSEEVKKKLKWRAVGREEKGVGDRIIEGKKETYITPYLLNNILLTIRSLSYVDVT